MTPREITTTNIVVCIIAAWRLLQFETSGRYPAIQRLAIHLEGEHQVYYRDEEGLRRQMTTGRANRTTLTEFYRLNWLNAVGLGVRARSLLWNK
jgi:hypothetical protein